MHARTCSCKLATCRLGLPLNVSAYTILHQCTEAVQYKPGLLVIGLLAENKKFNLVFDIRIDKVGQDTPNQKSWLRPCQLLGPAGVLPSPDQTPLICSPPGTNS